MVITAQKDLSTATPLRAGGALAPAEFDRLRRRLLLDGCKWDAQIGDTCTLSPFPLLLEGSAWDALSDLAGRLAAELHTAECELLHQPELHKILGLRRAFRKILGRADHPTPAAARTLRFDFHWTAIGWQISEVNSDVPGGFTESSDLPALISPHYPGARPAPNPGEIWADALAAACPAELPIVLIAAPGFIEDQQIIAYLARRLAERHRIPRRSAPDQLQWREGVAHHKNTRVGEIVRFYQAEWLHPCKVPHFFVGGKTPVANPGSAILTESKRFPLTWPHLAAQLPTWRSLLPETRDPRDAPWAHDDAWLVKSAYCNTGDTVAIRELLTPKQWNSVRRAVFFNPGNWIAQRRFAALSIPSPIGEIFPCIGVYTIDGRPAGIYGRYSAKPLIDFASIDAAVLITAPNNHPEPDLLT